MTRARLKAWGILALALGAAGVVLTASPVPERLLYAVLMFFYIFFGSIWLETTHRALHKYPTNHNKFVLWFFAACVTAWWIGAEGSRAATVLGVWGTRFQSLSSPLIEYTSWTVYASLFILLACGYMGLTLVRKNEPLSERREYLILSFVLFVSLALGVGATMG